MTRERGHDAQPRARSRTILRRAGLVLLALLVITILWWMWGRATAADRRMAIRSSPDIPVAAERDSGHIRVLAWNVAHGRGSRGPDVFANWRGGTEAERMDRLRRIADVVRNLAADVVVLNEVDFDAGWSHGVNQAEFLAERADYANRVEQTSFDLRTPVQSWTWGNAILTRLPLLEAAWLDLPPRSRLEEWIVGSKDGVVARLETSRGSVEIAAVHLEFRGEPTRLDAVAVLDSAASVSDAALVLAGDFNTAPPGWPEVGEETALGRLLALGFRSARAEAPPEPEELTYPTYGPRESRDWVLVQPPLRVIEARVVHEAAHLSDHAPVLAVVGLP